MKRSRSDRRADRLDQRTKQGPADPSFIADVVDREQNDDMSVAEDRLDILREVAALPHQQREALVLVEWLRFTAEEAGSLLGIKGVSVRARLHRARARLRRALEDAR